MFTTRTLRSTRSTAPPPPPVVLTAPSPITFTSNPSTSSSPSTKIHIITTNSTLPGLTKSELTLLRRKQAKLQSTASQTLASLPSKPYFQNALKSTLIFTQREAGTAVVISPSGDILTCAHCFGNTESEIRSSTRERWLLFYNGIAVQAKLKAWDVKRDLALLKVITAELCHEIGNGEAPTFSFIPLVSQVSTTTKTPVLCIGQPGADDLESHITGKTKTAYNLIEISAGALHPMHPDADPHDNSDIGSLRHDAWTYWGHSGAPLIKTSDGCLVGLHSSWDSDTGGRRGVPVVAVRVFLEENLPGWLNDH